MEKREEGWYTAYQLHTLAGIGKIIASNESLLVRMVKENYSVYLKGKRIGRNSMIAYAGLSLAGLAIHPFLGVIMPSLVLAYTYAKYKRLKFNDHKKEENALATGIHLLEAFKNQLNDYDESILSEEEAWKVIFKSRNKCLEKLLISSDNLAFTLNGE